MPSVPNPAVPPGVVPKAFLGGPLSDYRVILGKAGTLLSEHIPSGKKVPAVEVASFARDTLSTVAQLAKFGQGKLVVGAAVATVATGFAVYWADRQRAQIAGASAAALPKTTSAPILNPELGGPLLVEGAGTQPEAVSAPHSRAYPPKKRRRSPTRGCVSQPEVPALPQTGGPAGTAETTAEDARPRTGVDWTAATGTEVARARGEHAEGRTGEAVQRLRQLLLYLDEVPGKNGSPIYPAVTLGPLSALVEFAEVTDGSGRDAVSASEVEQWVERLEGLAETAAHEQET